MKLKVEDFSKSNVDWQSELYQYEDVNIGITFFRSNGDMYDQDILDAFPIFRRLNLGEVMMDDNGFLGLSTNMSVNDIETILLSNNFEIKRD
jgi:hypothetical protein